MYCACFVFCHCLIFCFSDTATTEIYTLSLHDALPIYSVAEREDGAPGPEQQVIARDLSRRLSRSEEHTSELQSLRHLVCRLLLEKKKKMTNTTMTATIYK